MNKGTTEGLFKGGGCLVTKEEEVDVPEVALEKEGWGTEKENLGLAWGRF